MKLKFTIIALFSFFLAIFACNQAVEKRELSSTQEKAMIKEGQGIALATFTVLSGALKKAIDEGGVANAIEYCNLNAAPIVDSLNIVHNTKIRRTALRFRNKANAPSESENAILKKYADQEQKGIKLKPTVQISAENNAVFYAPIRVNAFCLQCHGSVGNELKVEDYNLIKEKYPNDAAIGFKDGDLRGMWSIELLMPESK